MATKHRAVVYTRISQDRTGAGLGVQRQHDDCGELAERHGFEVVSVLSDNDISAYSGKTRPGYRALLELIRNGEVDVVLAWHVDRLHRSLRDLEEYIDACALHDVSTLTVRAGDLDLSTASGRMMARVLGSVARHESEQKSERVQRARRQAAEAGRAHGPLGYGYDDNRRIVPEEALVVQEVADRVLRGETLYSIAGDLTLRGVPTPGAGVWRWQQVRNIADRRGEWANDLSPVADAVRLLAGDVARASEAKRAIKAAWPTLTGEALETLVAIAGSESPGHGTVAAALTAAAATAPATTWRAANLGKMVQRGALCGWRDFEPGSRVGGGPLVAEGDWEPILDKSVTERLRAILNAPGRKVAGRHPLYLLSGTLTCGNCGARLVGVTDNRSGRRRYQCTKIPGTGRCGRLTVAAAPVDDDVTQAVLDVLSDVAFREGRRPTNKEGLDHAIAALGALDDEEHEWRADLASGAIDRTTFMDALDGIRTRRGPHEKAIGSASPTISAALTGVPVDRVRLERWWEEADVAAKRRVIRALIDHVEILPAARRSNAFDPARVADPVWRA